MILKIRDPRKGYEVNAGKIIGNVFHKEVTRSKHYFRMVSGYAIQEEVWNALQEHNVKRIVIKEKDTGAILTSFIEDWKEHLGKGNWGHGKQRVLSESYTTKSNSGEGEE